MESFEAGAAHEIVEEPRVGRRLKFTEEENLILVREVAAAKAHVAGHSEKRERHKTVALRVNGNPAVLVHINAKSVQDKYVKLQRKYELQDRKERNMTGLGGEFCEIDDLLGQMQEEKESLDAKNVQKLKLLERGI
jgi:uncharacterized FAD-dependent dehydrogenase